MELKIRKWREKNKKNFLMFLTIENKVIDIKEKKNIVTLRRLILMT